MDINIYQKLFLKGPNYWHIDFPVAIEGLRQSPIDINTDSAEKVMYRIQPKIKKYLFVFLYF